MGQAIASRNTAWGNVVVMSAAPPVESAQDASTTSNWLALEFSARPLSIRVNPDFVDRLEREVIDSFKSITKRGSEVGGMLLGQLGTDPRTVFVEDFELVPCAYTRGPLYLLSDVEKRRLEAAFRARKSRAERLVPIGFFRSNTRTSLALDEEDVSLIASYFTEPDSVMLLIKPFSMKPCLASFFAWENRPGEDTPGSVQFPFKRSEFPAKRGPVPALRRVEPSAPAPALEKEESQPSVPAATVEALVSTAPAPAASDLKEPVVEAPPPSPVPEVAAQVSSAPEAVTAVSQPPAEPMLKSAPDPAPQVPPAQSADAAPAPASVADGKPAPPAELRASPSAVPEPVEKANPAPLAPEPALPSEERAETPPARVPNARPGSRLLLWLQVLAAGLFLFNLGVYVQYKLVPRPDRRPGTASAPSLALKIERSGGQLYLDWDRNAAPIRAAQKASLFITDGDQEQVVPLSVNELRNGGFVYTPATSNVAFRIELTNLGDGRSVSESIRSVVGRPSPLGPPAPPASPAPNPLPALEVRPATAPPEPAATTQPPAKEEAQPAQPAPPAPEASTP